MSSGSKDFSLTVHKIIEKALSKLGTYEAGEQGQPDEFEDARIDLNLMVKEWSATGVDIPVRETVTVFLSKGTQSYTLGEGGDHAASSYVETTLSADAAASATTLALTSDADIAIADNIGVRLDDGTIHWATYAGSSVISSGLASAASSGNAVYAYTTQANRPQKVIYAMRRDTQGRDVPVDIIGEVAYQSLSDKSQTGEVNQAFYRTSVPTGTLFVWPAGAGKLILITQALVDDLDALTDTMQLPIEWGNCIIWNLAAELAPEYGTLSAKDQLTLERRAAQKLANLLDYDVENASVILGLDVQ